MTFKTVGEQLDALKAAKVCKPEDHDYIETLSVYNGHAADTAWYQHDAAFFPLNAKHIREILVAQACIDPHLLLTYEVTYGDGCTHYAEFEPTDEEWPAIIEARFARRS